MSTTSDKNEGGEKNELTQRELLEAAAKLDAFAKLFRDTVEKMRSFGLTQIPTSNWVSSGERSFVLLERVRKSLAESLGFYVLAAETKQQVDAVVETLRAAEAEIETTTPLVESPCVANDKADTKPSRKRRQ